LATTEASPANNLDAARKKRRARNLFLGLLVLSGILLRAYIFNHLPHDLSVCTTDFSAFYAGGKLAGTPNLYVPQAAFDVERQAMGCVMENLVFIRPPFYALLMWPLAQLPFMTALELWRVLGLAAVGAFIWMWPGDKWIAAAACAWYLPLANNFTVGQDVAFLLVLLLGAYHCLKADRQFWAGILLGLCLIKFHLLVLLPLLIFHKKLWRTLLGISVAGVIALSASYVAGGRHWMEYYLAALHDFRMDPYPWNMINLKALFYYHPEWLIPSVAVIVLVSWYVIYKGSLEVSLAAVLIGGVLINPHTTIADGTLILPVFLMARRAPLIILRVLATFALTPFYQFLPTGTFQVIVIATLFLGVWMLWQQRGGSVSRIPT
jgi:Glycosyltransferase family 87